MVSRIIAFRMTRSVRMQAVIALRFSGLAALNAASTPLGTAARLSAVCISELRRHVSKTAGWW